MCQSAELGCDGRSVLGGITIGHFAAGTPGRHLIADQHSVTGEQIQITHVVHPARAQIGHTADRDVGCVAVSSSRRLLC